MELDLDAFRKIEITAWIAAVSLLVFACGHLFVLLILGIVTRLVYIKYKNNKLGFIDPRGKPILITGCDSGFGLALAKSLHTKGATVFATCLNTQSNGARELQKLGGSLQVLPLDVGKDESVAMCLRAVTTQCSNSGLWGLVNNAGMNYIGDCELSTMSQYLEVANVNLYGMVRTCKAFLPLLRQAKGRILNVTSVKGLCPTPSNANYTITKYGGEAFSEILRQEMDQFGIKVCIIEPGNFGGITGCLKDDGMKRCKQLLDEMWEEASEDVKTFYGKYHLHQQLEDAKKSASTSYPTMDPVIKAFEDGLFNQCPHVRYLVHGSNSLVDKYCLVALVAPYLPQTFLDRLRSYLFPYVVHGR